MLPYFEDFNNRKEFAIVDFISSFYRNYFLEKKLLDVISLN